MKPVADAIGVGKPTSTPTTTTFEIEGMCCSNEVRLVEETLAPLAGVAQVQVNLAAGVARVGHAPGLEASAVEEALANVGLSARARGRAGRGDDDGAGRSGWWHDRALLSVIAAGLLIILALVFTHVFAWTSAAIASFILATVIGGLPVFRNAIRSAKRLDLDINVLMTVAVIGALILGEWLEAAMVVGLFGFADWLEGASMARARNAIGQLMELAPDEARVLRGGREEMVPVELVGIGEHVIVRPGEKIPVDGVVEAGESEVDQAPITGESKPVHKQVGDPVFAGTLNQRGSLDIRVEHAPDDTTLAKVVEAIESAQQNRSESERFVEKFARYYTPAVILLAILAALLPPLLLGASWEVWFYRSLVLLVIACPCALVLATPITTASALARAARDGILIKGGRFLEQLGCTRAVAFDKTGTLTRGEPQVTDVMAAEGFDARAVLELAAIAESRSEHYLASAITEAARAREIAVERGQLWGFEARIGRGVVAQMRGQGEDASVQLLVGTRALLAEHGVDYSALSDGWRALEQRGQTVVGVARAGELAGLVAIEDTPRADARATVEWLGEQGARAVYMLTGDNAVSAQGIAQAVGLERDSVLADLLPADKVSAIKELTERHEHVAMVGDGINDAPALAAASVGIAMGAAGTDIALESAHVALMGDDLKKLPHAIDLGARTGRIIRQNVVLALGIKALVFGLAAAGVATLWMAVLADTGTSLLVIFNGMRMLRASK
ncbi:heavy metal translocating P-type ATPase [Bradymonas sediminis]|uniref:Cadmium-translocating P-type ATPase n=1 Tax=Bradymonas sediminis TaxID=1548548 RepID=A0A2Z4FNH5_9DELT|nr:cation-translocating P-type ATPase [Bradymonas sediminis]AWV90410.1 cadmium-translocating P-type ATPase [Bradymonas sediminis]TDP72204.1 Cd2+/Zn2+-exporting ATPase [Bradymonas sediminis]